MGCTRFSDELADLQHVPRQQSQARSTARFEIAADRPFAGTKTHRQPSRAASLSAYCCPIAVTHFCFSGVAVDAALCRSFSIRDVQITAQMSMSFRRRAAA